MKSTGAISAEGRPSGRDAKGRRLGETERSPLAVGHASPSGAQVGRPVRPKPLPYERRRGFGRHRTPEAVSSPWRPRVLAASRLANASPPPAQRLRSTGGDLDEGSASHKAAPGGDTRRRRTKAENPPTLSREGCLVQQDSPGNVLLSHKITLAVPSAPTSLTSEFGMGSGMASSISPPEWLVSKTAWQAFCGGTRKSVAPEGC